ncbi:hypothetical protein Dimus_014692 [Dionaea muscipula]
MRSYSSCWALPFLASLCLLSLVPSNHGWGKDGHYTTCKLAESLFSTRTASAVKALIEPTGARDLASLCSWADQVRFSYHWSSALHFADIRDPNGCNFDHDSTGLCGYPGRVGQPLHCGHAVDKGGNTIDLHWYKAKSNLHHVWDTNIIYSEEDDFSAMKTVDHLVSAISQNITLFNILRVNGQAQFNNGRNAAAASLHVQACM